MPTAAAEYVAMSPIVRLLCSQIANFIHGSCTIWTWTPDGFKMKAHDGRYPNYWEQEPGKRDAQEVYESGYIIESKTIPGAILLPYYSDGEKAGIMSLNGQKDKEEVLALAEVFCALMEGALPPVVSRKEKRSDSPAKRPRESLLDGDIL